MKVYITHEELYNKLCDIEKKMNCNENKQDKKIAINGWVAGTSLTIGLLIVGGLIFT